MSHPYISGAGNIASMIEHLRKSFPSTIDSGTVKKLGLAPKNESYVINCLQFIGVIDEDGKKTQEAGAAFSQHKDEDFQKAFSQLVKNAYSDIFELHGDAAWTPSRHDLITFFRSADQTSDTIGGRQARVFQVLSNKSGKSDDNSAQRSAAVASKPTSSNTSAKATTKTKTGKKPKAPVLEKSGQASPVTNKDFGLSVRVEINLPSDASAETYDNIFKSIKKNLMS